MGPYFLHFLLFFFFGWLGLEIFSCSILRYCVGGRGGTDMTRNWFTPIQTFIWGGDGALLRLEIQFFFFIFGWGLTHLAIPSFPLNLQGGGGLLINDFWYYFSYLFGGGNGALTRNRSWIILLFFCLWMGHLLSPYQFLSLSRGEGGRDMTSAWF